MDIYILREGREIGPFTPETARTLIAQGDVTSDDLSWRPKMQKWVPLDELLRVELPPRHAPVAVAPTRAHQPMTLPPREPATAKQKAMLTFIGMRFDAGLTKDEAALAISDALEDPALAERVNRWNRERLRIHPELFAAELEARRENRVNRFHEICQVEGAQFFEHISKAHVQVLVNYLDITYPNWDANDAEATHHYFFPAVSEKFPQLVFRQWRGRFKYPSKSKVATDLARHGDAASSSSSSGMAFSGAIAKGVLFGLIVLGVLWFVERLINADASKPAGAMAVKSSATSTGALPVSGEPTDQPAIATTGTLIQPGAAQITVASETPESIPAPVPAVAPQPLAENPPATPAPSMAETAATIPPAHPLPPIPDAITAPASPAASVSEVRLVKPISVALTYGQITLPAGTVLRVVSRNGALLRATYLNTSITVPVSSTNLPDAAAPAEALSSVANFSGALSDGKSREP